jgi:small subunit ribosomal protein S9
MIAAKTDKITGEALGTGRRKTAVARVRIRSGSGKFIVNGRALEDFFHVEGDRRAVMEVLQAANKSDSVDVVIRVTGGGSSGQAGACRMGIARALISYDSGLFCVLRDGRFLTRDSRMKERKKYGLHGARRGVQFSKR